MTNPPPREGIGPDSSGEPGTSLLRLAAVFLRRWRFIALLGFLGAVVAAAWSLVAEPRYRSVARFALEEQRGLPTAGGLAAIAGRLGGGALGGIRSLQFYADLLVGPDILGAVLADSFPHPEDPSRRAALIDILEVDGDTPEERRLRGVELLQERVVATSTNDRTGTISLEVSLRDPDLAAAVAGNLYRHLEQFNFETRRSSASERREFAERELERARGELTAAESAMRGFLESNRGGLDIPRLDFRRQQLQRRIDLANDTYSRLALELQEASIDEVRDTPVFTLVQRPIAPIYREFPRRTRMTLIGGILGGALAVLVIIVQVSTRSARAIDPSGFAELRAALRGGASTTR
ncbi:MAG TPA: Wzz/FepE/Etk N-terminal domain-containing protein [Gemmatimonadales bacterium]